MLISQKSFDRFGEFVNQDFYQFLKNTGRGYQFKKAENHLLLDDNNIEYADWVAGFGSLNLGHNPHQVLEELHQGLVNEYPSIYLDAINPFTGELASHFCKVTNGHFQNVILGSSGAEAVETAVKVAISATKRNKIISVSGAFHGTSLGALSFMSDGPYVEDFKPVIMKNIQIPWSDLKALETSLKENQAAAFLIEPVQIEGGVRCPHEGYFKKVAELCKQFGTLLIMDEIQTGLGRCGTLFAFEQFEVIPDILLSGKSLGAGLVPVSATLIKAGLWQKAFHGPLKHDIHNSTMSGNKLSCIAANKVLEIVSDSNFLERVKELGGYLGRQLQQSLAPFTCIEEIRGKGLLYGLKLKEVEAPWLQWEQMGIPDFQGKPVVGAILIERLFRFNKITQVCAHDWSVLRIEPPLTINEQVIDDFIKALVSAVSWMEENAY